MTRSHLIPTALLGAAALTFAGCGDASKKQAQAPPKGPNAAGIVKAFEAATGVALERRDLGSSLTTLSAPAGQSGRFGTFTINLVRDEAARAALLAGGTSRSVKEYGADVVVSSYGGEEGEAAARLDRAVRAAVKGDPSLVPAEERPCAAEPEGTCWLGEKRLTVAGAREELETPVLQARIVAATVARQLPARSQYSEPERAKGRFLVVRYRVTNTTNAPLSSLRPALVLGGKSYTTSPAAYSLPGADAFPIQPDDAGTLTTVFDLAADVAEDARARGELELPAGQLEGSSYLSDTDAVGRLRLDGAPTLALGNAVSTKREERKAAAEGALKQFYTALRKGNVTFVCKRITTAARRAAGCGLDGRFVKAKAKRVAPQGGSTGLEFTTLLTNGQSRAYITVRRKGGGFTDSARLAKQGGLWRVQYTRRLLAAG